MNNVYWDGVIANMEEQDCVRFGTTGGGTHPNYEIISQSGNSATYLGQNHEPDSTPEYDEAHITGEYALADIKSPMIRGQIQNLITG